MVNFFSPGEVRTWVYLATLKICGPDSSPLCIISGLKASAAVYCWGWSLIPLSPLQSFPIPNGRIGKTKRQAHPACFFARLIAEERTLQAQDNASRPGASTNEGNCLFSPNEKTRSQLGTCIVI